MSETETIAADTATPVASPDLASLSKSDLAAWRQTGDVPAPKTSDVTAESSTAQPDGQAAEIAASSPAASEPAPPKKANAETRKAELNAEIQALLKQRDELKASLSSTPRPTAPDVNQTASSTVTQPVSLESFIESPDARQPILKEDAFYTQFPEATVADYVRYAASYQAERVAVRRDESQTFREREAAFVERAKTIAPDIAEKLPPELLNAKPVDLMGPGETRGLWNVALQEILNSADPNKLLTHLVSTPDAMARIRATQNEAETIRTIAQMEARLDGPSVSPKPVAKATTTAPPPPPTLGSKPSIPADEVDQALASGDVKTYIRVMNEREMQGRL